MLNLEGRRKPMPKKTKAAELTERFNKTPRCRNAK
jgi:hypothetical protein